MKAVRWMGPRRLSVDEVPDPRLQEATDAVIKVTATGICGSDLHLYDHGATLGMKPGDIVGHEAMGVVQVVGSEVAHIAPGDTVVVPFNISCGHSSTKCAGQRRHCGSTNSWLFVCVVRRTGHGWADGHVETTGDPPPVGEREESTWYSGVTEGTRNGFAPSIRTRAPSM